MSDPIDFEAERFKRDQAAGERANENGEAFAFQPYTFDDLGVGLIDGDRPVVVMTKPDTLSGICMSREDALNLAEALIGAASGPEPDLDIDPEGP